MGAKAVAIVKTAMTMKKKLKHAGGHLARKGGIINHREGQGVKYFINQKVQDLVDVPIVRKEQHIVMITGDAPIVEKGSDRRPKLILPLVELWT